MVSPEGIEEPINYEIYFQQDTIEFPEPTTNYTANFTLTKSGIGAYSYTTEQTDYGTLYNIQAASVNLSGAGFALYDSSDQKNWELVDKNIYFTNDDGEIVFSNIALDKVNDQGKEYLAVCEYFVPTGYGKLNTNSNIFELNVGDKTYYCHGYTVDTAQNDNNVVTLRKQDTDSYKTFSLQLYKTDQNNNKLEGRKFGVFTTEEIKLGNGTTIPAGSMVAMLQTDSEGAAFKNFDDATSYYLPTTQDYEIRELNDENNSAVYSGDITKEFYTENGENKNKIIIKTSEQSEDFKQYTVRVQNTVEGKVKFHKTNSSTGTNVSGILFTLTSKNDSTKVYEAITDENGIAEISLPSGTYVASENVGEEYFTTKIDGDIKVDTTTVNTIEVANAPAYSGSIAIQKEITNDPKKNDEFNFAVYSVITNVDGDEVETLIGQYKIKGTGSTTFNYKINELGTYKYRIKEIKGDLTTYTYDEEVYEETIIATRKDENTINISKSATKGNGVVSADTATFTNVYIPNAAEYQLTINKTIGNTNIMPSNDIDKYEFTFTVKNKNDDKDVKTTTVKTTNGTGSSNIDLKFTKTGTYEYTVTENETTDFYANSESYDITVVVTQDGESLKADTTIKKEEKVVDKVLFTNT